MSISAWPSIKPSRPRSASLRASSTSRRLRKERKSSATKTIMSGPPTNSPATNSQPRSTAMMIPSSITRLVEAIWNAIAAVKFAPWRKSERASATEAYEQLEDAAPSPVATASVRGESSGRSLRISRFDTTACTTAERPKPRMSAQMTSHVIPNANENALHSSCGMSSASGKAYEEGASTASRPRRDCRRKTPPTRSSSSSTAVSASRFRATAPRAWPGVATASISPYIEASRTPSADGGHAAEKDDRGRLRMGAHRAQHQPERRSADHPGAGVEDEERAQRARPHVRQLLLVAEPPQHLVGQGPEDAGLHQDRDHHAEDDERRERRLDVVDVGEAEHEDHHAGDGREPRLEQHRRGHERRVGDACPPGGDDARRRSPDPSGDVLREHRDHLSPQGRRI